MRPGEEINTVLGGLREEYPALRGELWETGDVPGRDGYRGRGRGLVPFTSDLCSVWRLAFIWWCYF